MWRGGDGGGGRGRTHCGGESEGVWRMTWREQSDQVMGGVDGAS